MDYYYPLSKEWTQDWAEKFIPLYEYLVRNPSKCKYINYKYVCFSEHSKSLVKKFPFIKDIPNFDYKDESMYFAFLTLNGKNKKSWTPHIDPDNTKWDITLPLLNCTNETITTWLDPLEETRDIRGDETMQVYTGEYKVLAKTSITDHALVLRSDILHKVDIMHDRDETRVVVKFFIPKLELEDILKQVY